MPRVSRWYLRTAWLHFVLASTWGALMLTYKAWPGLGAWVWRLRGWHLEAMLVGWVAQTILGVLFWWLPKLPGGVSRGPTGPVWLAYGLLNAGVTLVVLASWGVVGDGLRAGRALEILAGLAFALNAWPRIRPLVRARPRSTASEPSS